MMRFLHLSRSSGWGSGGFHPSFLQRRPRSLSSGFSSSSSLFAYNIRVYRSFFSLSRLICLYDDDLVGWGQKLRFNPSNDFTYTGILTSGRHRL